MNQSTTYRNNLGLYSIESNNIFKNNYESHMFLKLGLNITESEVQLNDRMSKIREEYRSRHETMRMPFPPAEPFYKVKKDIESCDLFNKVFKKMPKGGLLHVHSSASLSVDELMKLLEFWMMQGDKDIYPDIYIVTIQNERQEKIAIGTLMYEYQINKANLKDYCEKLSDFIKTPKNKKWLMELLTFGSDRIKQFPYLWDEFNTIFTRTCRLFEMYEFYFMYHMSFFQECIADNINYIELRCGFEEVYHCVSEIPARNNLSENHELNVGYRNYMYHKDMNLKLDPWKPDTLFLDALLAAEKQVKKYNMDFRLKVILCARRALDPVKDIDALLKKVDAAIIIKNMNIKYNKLITGFDFVSEEDRGQPTHNYVQNIIYKEMGIGYKDDSISIKIQSMYPDLYGKSRIQQIDFYLHDGESNWNDNTNVISAAIVSKNRIGHGFNMNKFQGCIRNISFINGSINANPQYPILEICPISNQLLGYYPDLRNHSAYELMCQGILCSISSDDPQIFDNPGLSYDYWECFVGMWMDMDMIKGLVYVSYYEYCTKGLELKDDKVIKSRFEIEWLKFVTQALSDLKCIQEADEGEDVKS